jgi:hypothetical protein
MSAYSIGRKKSIKAVQSLEKDERTPTVGASRMVLAEVIGVICAIVVGVLVFKNSRVYQIFQAERVTERDKLGMKKQESADFYFKLNGVFELRLKSRSDAKFLQYGLLAVLMAIAFLIVTFGLKNLGIG